MLNASYNLPSEDCNTEKQMVFHSNKLLCVYSLQSWLSDTFTFGSELPCRCQPEGKTQRLWEGASCAGGYPARPPATPGGSAAVQNQITGERCAQVSASTCSSGRTLRASCLWRRLHQGHGGGSKARPTASPSVPAQDHTPSRPGRPLEPAERCSRDKLLCSVGAPQGRHQKLGL